MPAIKIYRFVAIFILIAGLAPVDSSAAGELDIAQFMKERGAAIVTVKYVLHVNMGKNRGNQESETEQELTCIMIRTDGLLICSNNQLTGFINMIARMSPQLGIMSATPKNLEVIVDSHEQAFEAEILAVDTELDIAWIQITETRDTTFSFLDFATGTTADVGESVFALRRTGNHFGRTLVAVRNLIGGSTGKPRKLYIPASAFANGGGWPVFNRDGRVIGLIVTQFPESSGSTAGGMGLLGSGMANFHEGQSGLILPANEVVRATQRAMDVESY